MAHRILYNCLVFVFILQGAFCDEAPSSDREAKLRARRDQFEQQRPSDLDFSDLSTEELVRRAVESSSDPGDYFKQYCRELAGRGATAKGAISDYLTQPNIGVDALAALPKVAGYIDVPFQVETAKKCLFHARAPQIDDWAIRQGALLRLVSRSPNDETSVLDELIASGRLEAGSEAERYWRSAFVSGIGASSEVRRNTENEHSPTDNKSNSGLGSGESNHGLRSEEGQGFELRTMLIALLGGIVLVGIVLLAARSFRRRKLTQDRSK